MKYMGSKQRIAKNILAIILKGRTPEQWYVEPFCGGCNTIDKVIGNRLANDNNRYLIALWKALQSGLSFQTEITREIYDAARKQYNDKEAGKDGLYWSDAELGWIGFMASYSGKFYNGGYSGQVKTKINTIRDYISESIRNVNRQMPLLKDVVFTHGDYREIQLPPNSIVYCDIPYKSTTNYATSNSFNHDLFYDWCRKTVANGHSLFISEYEMPEDFKCVWSGEVKSSLSANGVSGGNKVSVEKLFTLNC